jgi:hypothetical protein
VRTSASRRSSSVIIGGWLEIFETHTCDRNKLRFGGF